MHGPSRTPTYPLDGSNTWGGSPSSSSSYSSSSSSSSNPLEGFDIHHASPRKKREKFSHLVQRELDSKDANWRRKPLYQTQKIERVQEEFFRVVDYQNQITGALAVGFAGSFYGSFSTFLSVEKALDSVWKGIRENCLQRPQIDLTDLKTNLVDSVADPKYPWLPPIPIALAILVAGCSITVISWDYEVFARELNSEILRVFNRIGDQNPEERISAQQLLDQARGILRRKEESWFGKTYESRNPIPMNCLLFTKAIALDSLGSHAEAQLDYEAALNLRYYYHHIIEDMIRFAYARSLRLSGQPSDTILAQIDRIGTDSPFHRLAQIERMIVNNNSDHTEEVDQNETPHDFICPITQTVMADPVSHEFKELIRCCYFERVALQTWVNNHQTCPCCLKKINGVLLVTEKIYPLFTNKNLQRLIQLWNTTRLIQKTLL